MFIQATRRYNNAISNWVKEKLLLTNYITFIQTTWRFNNAMFETLFKRHVIETMRRSNNAMFETLLKRRDVVIMRCLTYEVTTACVTIAPRAESASLLLKLPVKSSQIPIQLKQSWEL